MAKKNRPACISDLEKYFKKIDLLGGLTEPEKKQLRHNIGVVDFVNDNNEVVPGPVSYSELWDLIQRNQIITGAKYLIKDFQTIYSSNVINQFGNKESWGTTINPSTIYQLIVTGADKNRLDTTAYIQGKNWEIKYDPTRKLLEDGVYTKGQITWLKDGNGNSAFYDFKNVKFRRTREELRGTTINNLPTYLDLFTFSIINNNLTVIDASETDSIEYNELKLNCWNNIFLGETFDNIIEPECRNNTFIKGLEKSHILWKSNNNFFNEKVNYTTGAINDKIINIGDKTFSTTISKTIHKVNDATILSFLDPITYAYQVIIL